MTNNSATKTAVG